jgi:hypothetical protein
MALERADQTVMARRARLSAVALTVLALRPAGEARGDVPETKPLLRMHTKQRHERRKHQDSLGAGALSRVVVHEVVGAIA